MRGRFGLMRSVALLVVATVLGFGLDAIAGQGQTSPQSAAHPTHAPSTQAKPAAATAMSSSVAARGEVRIPIRDFVLANGLRVYLSEDHSAPTYSIAIAYDVGSRNERAGRTGFAHLFEHMMFQGSENVGKGEHLILVYTNGGGVDGTTNKDRTLFFETLPANQLDLGLFLEADRMRSLAVTQANLDNQRNAVQEERRLRVDNQPYGKTYEVVDELAYDNKAYKHSVIGSMADLNAASLQDVQSFFKTYYAPNNAALALVGDFDSQEALAKIKKYFESIPRQPTPPQPDMLQPVQSSERRTTIDDSFARLARVDIVYHIPPANTPDWYALDMLGDILAKGDSSRLYQELIEDKQLSVGLRAGPDLARGPALFRISANVAPGKATGDLENAIETDLNRIKTAGVTPDEMKKVLMLDKVDIIRIDESTIGRATQIANDAVCFHDPGLINEMYGKYKLVTAAQIKLVAQKYFSVTNRTVVTTLPAPRFGTTGGAQ
jgi:zinc protease